MFDLIFFLCLLNSSFFLLFFSVSSPRLYAAKAQVYEKASLQGMQQLVHRSYQTLALWKLLCDHQFSLIMSELPKVNVRANSRTRCLTNRCCYSCTAAFSHMLLCLLARIPLYRVSPLFPVSEVACFLSLLIFGSLLFLRSFKIR